MKTKLFYLFILMFSLSYGQNPTEAINGTYHLLESERGIGNKQTKTKIFQYGLFGDTKVLAVAACGKCMTAIYKYQKEDSEELKVSVFFNEIGLTMITYDNESFVMIMPSTREEAEWTDFSFSNFYSKSKVKVASMTQKKIKEFIIKISE